ncbi:hypothetical protein RIF29_04284 [Crotalaria pallida]|uniref:Amino acid transporter transmembrane domain-containing protein n=1 Tax=Crotalaria pallida TaxID=3830 RepID=A0AAN9P9Y7_CROPI
MGMGNAENDSTKVYADENNMDIEVPDTAHQISSVACSCKLRDCPDSWLQVTFVLTTGVNSAFVLGYSGGIMVPLGWVGGVVGLVLATAISLYANALIAKLHEHGGVRHIRYRDLAGYIYGRKAYTLTWILQYVNLFMAFYVLFRDDDQMKLPYFIAIGGVGCGIFAISTPHLSALGTWMGISTFLTVIYIVITIGLSINDGIKSPARDYSIPAEGSSNVFSIIGSCATLVFAFNTGMVPEIQATIKQPVVKNMLKALNFQFTIGLVPFFLIVFAGYWAYGSSTGTYLLNNVTGPVWVKGLANIAAVLQSIISLHIFASPVYEYLDTKFGIKGSALKVKNLSFRIAVRGGYLGFSTFLAALLPFLGDFMSLTGAISTFPLTFILANHMYLVAKDNRLASSQKLWHWFNIVFFSIASVAATIAAIRLIVVDSKTYHVFADM